VSTYVYFTATVDAVVWGAELAAGPARGRIYIVEATGAFENDPNLSDKKFPGNPTQSFRSREPAARRRRPDRLGRPLTRRAAGHARRTRCAGVTGSGPD
jgi:hypothetical protein